MQRLNKLISILACLFLALFLLITAWDVTAHGYFEPADLNTSHFIAGAGNASLLLRLMLGVASFIMFFVWLAFSRKPKVVIPKIVVLILVPLIFEFSANGLERFGVEYNEQTFNTIVDEFQKGEPIDTTQVQARLGTPLASGVQTILLQHRPHHTAWLYTYMPSCGFGWHKRVIYFNTQQQMTDYLGMDEP